MSQPGTYPPLDRRAVAWRLIGGGLLLALALAVVGWLIVKLLTPSALTRWEDSVSTWLFEHRTPRMNTLTQIGSNLADTVSCISILIVLFFVFRWWLGRWRESWTLFAAIVGELLVFLIVTAVVNRDRPTVPHLDAAPPTSSFPSGHTAAAVALYGCIAVIVLRMLRPRWLAVLIAIVCTLIPVVVAVSRLYRGMHHVSDVVFGAIGGGLWLLIVLTTLLPPLVGTSGDEQRAGRHEVAVRPPGSDTA